MLGGAGGASGRTTLRRGIRGGRQAETLPSLCINSLWCGQRSTYHQSHEVVAPAVAAGVPVTVLGTVGGDRFELEGLLDEPLATLADAFHNGLERALEG